MAVVVVVDITSVVGGTGSGGISGDICSGGISGDICSGGISGDICSGIGGVKGTSWLMSFTVIFRNYGAA